MFLHSRPFVPWLTSNPSSRKSFPIPSPMAIRSTSGSSCNNSGKCGNSDFTLKRTLPQRRNVNGKPAVVQKIRFYMIGNSQQGLHLKNPFCGPLKRHQVLFESTHDFLKTVDPVAPPYKELY